VASSPKGQVEMILELCDNSLESKTEDELKYDKNLNPFESEEEVKSSRTRFSLSSLSEVKLPGVKKLLLKPKREKCRDGMCLKITTSKMRCSIKVKEEFESDAGETFCLI
jgi:hypothetical protein